MASNDYWHSYRILPDDTAAGLRYVQLRAKRRTKELAIIYYLLDAQHCSGAGCRALYMERAGRKREPPKIKS